MSFLQDVVDARRMWESATRGGETKTESAKQTEYGRVGMVRGA
jgi:hypothetical protein